MISSILATSNVKVRLKRPHPKQREFIRSGAARRVIRAGRRSGKTTGLAILAVEAFLAGERVLYAVPTTDQLNRFWKEVTAALREPIDAGVFKQNMTEHSIELPWTEQRLRAKSAFNADTLRGDFANLLILDEFQLINEDAWEVVGAPMLLDRAGKAVFCYTPPSFRAAGMSKAHDPRHAAKMYQRAANDTSGRWAAWSFSSHDNPHISADALAEISSDMTTLAYRQEIMAEDLESIPGALWSLQQLDATRVQHVPELVRIVVGIDPGYHAGIVVAGRDANGHAYVLEDASVTGDPDTWAQQAVAVYHRYRAHALVPERNHGGDMVETTIRHVDTKVHIKTVWASQGKYARAEPVSVLYSKGLVHHVGVFPELEEQLCGWVANSGQPSPDRLDSCFIAGTMVTTQRGDIPIEQVTTTDRVLTRSGWQRVVRSTCTAQEALVYTVEFSDGCSLTGTGNHPIFVQDKGFIPLDSLVWGDTMVTCKNVKPSHSTVSSTHDFLITPSVTGGSILWHPAKAGKACITVTSGYRFMDLSPLGGISTTKTTTHLTMPWRIWHALLQLSMRKNTPRWQAGHPKSWPPFARWLRSGMARWKVEHGMASMGSKYGKTSGPYHLSAQHAVYCTMPSSRQSQGHIIAVENVQDVLPMLNNVMLQKSPALVAERPFSAVNIKQHQPPVLTTVVRRYASNAATVFNLEVSQQPEYFANGILVHNCVWAITDLLLGDAAPPLVAPIIIGRR